MQSDTEILPDKKRVVPADVVHWQLRDVRGTKETVLAAIAAAEMPAEVKVFLSARVNACGFAGIRLEAHGHLHEGQEHGSHAIVKLF